MPLSRLSMGMKDKEDVAAVFFWTYAALIITIVAVIVPESKLSWVDKKETTERSWTSNNKTRKPNPPPQTNQKHQHTSKTDPSPPSPPPNTIPAQLPQDAAPKAATAGEQPRSRHAKTTHLSKIVLVMLRLTASKVEGNFFWITLRSSSQWVFFFAGGCLGWSRAERPSVSWAMVSRTLWSDSPSR